jgi:hypothetical protein
MVIPGLNGMKKNDTKELSKIQAFDGCLFRQQLWNN